MSDMQLREGETLGEPVQAPKLNAGETLGDVVQAQPEDTTSDQTGGRTEEEQAYLKANPNTAYMPADTNRPAGIYPTGAGNEWRKDKSYEQQPIDLHLGEHTVEHGLGSALAVGAIPAAGLLAPTSRMVPSGSGFTRQLIEEEAPSLARQGLGKIVSGTKALINSPTAASAARIAEGLGIGAGGYYGFKSWLNSRGGK